MWHYTKIPYIPSSELSTKNFRCFSSPSLRVGVCAWYSIGKQKENHRKGGVLFLKTSYGRLISLSSTNLFRKARFICFLSYPRKVQDILFNHTSILNHYSNYCAFVYKVMAFLKSTLHSLYTNALFCIFRYP